MGVRSRSGGPQPKDAAWLAEQVRLDAEVARQVDHVEDIVSHVGGRELERRAARILGGRR